MCGAAPNSGAKWYYTKKGSNAPLDDKCAECFDTFLESWCHKGSWSEVCELVAADDEARQRFELSKAVRSGSTSRSFFQEAVDKVYSDELEVSKSLVGLSHEQFRATFGGANIEDLGYKAQELHDVNNKSYRGILMLDPMAQGIRYTFKRRIMLSRTEPKMPPARHLHPEQSSEVFESERGKQEKSSALYAKFRTCTLTRAAIEEAIAATADDGAPRSAAARQATASSSPGTAALAVSAGDDDDDSECEAEAVGAVAVLNPQALAGASFVGMGALSSAGSFASPRPKTVFLGGGGGGGGDSDGPAISPASKYKDPITPQDRMWLLGARSLKALWVGWRRSFGLTVGSSRGVSANSSRMPLEAGGETVP